ncbi:MAG: RNA polymerase subunit sigma, partial [Clostridia bacterium]|nr:RNA polymerase subunit sigma [Clostridia bacterium]
MRFDEVYAKYFSDVYRYLLRLSGNEDVAEELASETFFKALGAIDSFRGECSLYA